MENGVNSYLHKKFKKQLSIEYCKQIVQLDKKNEVKNREEPLQNIIQVANPVKHQNGYLEAAPIANQFEGPPCQSEVIVDNLENVPNQKIVQVKTSSISNNDLVNLKNSISNSQKFQDEFNKMYAPKITTSSITMSSFIPEPERPIETTEVKQDKQTNNSTSSGSGKYICNYCNLACSKPSVLQKHIRAHTNERPYPCVSCGFSFKTRSNLYKHCRSRTHANRVLGNTNSNKNPEENDCDTETMQMLNISDLQVDNDNQSKSSKVYKPRFHPPVHTDSDETINIEPQDILSHHINEIITKKSDFRSYPTYELNQDEPLNLSTATNVGRQSPPQLSPIKVTMSPIRDIYEPKNLPRNGTTDYAKIWAQGHFDERFSNQALNSPNSSPNIVLQSAKNDLSVISQNKHNAANIAKNYSNEYDYYQERLNHLTARKRSNSEAPSPKSVIKELLLKNLSSSDNMQCPHCKMLFQTVTELELHKLRSCKGFVKPGAKYTRSSSVNVASILHQDKNAFAYSPQMSNAVFPLKSPGPFLGKTRLVESDKTKSFSCDESFQQSYRLSPISFQEKKVQPVKLFGGEVQITTNEDKSFKIDDRDTKMQNNLSENTVVKSSLQSGGTVLTNKVTYEKNDMISANSSFSIYPPTSNKLLHNGSAPDKNKKKPPDLVIKPTNEFYPYPNIVDFSQNAVRLLTPNLKQPNMIMTASPMSVPKFSFTPTTEPLRVEIDDHIMSKKFMLNPLSICVDGKMVPHVPGMPGPIQTVDPIDFTFHPKQLVSPASFKNLISPNRPKDLTPSEAEKYHLLSPSEHHLKEQLSPNMLAKNNEILRAKIRHRKLSPNKTPTNVLVNNNNEVKKFARPNSLALKPTTASLKQNHGLTPTMFNQILISPDTPRVAKKYVQQFLNGNYFSYLGLKSTTKPVYCTLNKTQPFYVPHFKKLSMYSEWRQQDTKNDKLYVSGFDSRQRNSKYSVAGSKGADLIVHSTYKFVASEVSQSQSSDKNEDAKNQNGIAGGYESNEDYTYIRGRGRGRYVCEQCGIRCKKPSMLKKHIRTHSNDRPYTCSHCNFSFKTKGNLTKHMKSKAHTKNYTASNSSNSSNQQSTPSSDSDTDDSGMDSSDESSTRQQEHEAAYGLLSLSQKSQPLTFTTNNTLTTSPSKHTHDKTPLMNSEEIFIVTQTNFAKNKMITDKMNGLKFDTISTTISELRLDEDNKSNANHNALGKINNSRRPLTYPYTTILPNEGPLSSSSNSSEKSASSYEPEVNIRQFNVIKQYITDVKEPKKDNPSIGAAPSPLNVRLGSQVIAQNPIIKVNDSVIVTDSTCDLRKRNFTDLDTPETIIKRPKNDLIIMDLSKEINNSTKTHNLPEKSEKPITNAIDFKNEYNKFLNTKLNIHVPNKEPSVNFTPEQLSQTPQQSQTEHFIDTTAMETLADVATKQEKLEKNSIAKNVASEFLKLATKNEGNNDELNAGMRLAPLGKEVNDMMVKSEGSKSCTICSKSFSKPSQLRLHMNIHYLERPYRCDSCSVSFRTKGHLQKHERSASHNSKLSSSPALSSSEPRPFKCSDCNIAFRIHGHLAKHLRSKMHIMKLECLAKIPFGLYAELERSNSLLTEINTADGDQCLESLKTLAQKVFMNDPTKLNHLVNSSEMLEVD